MDYELDPLTDHGMGAEVTRLDLTQPMPDRVRATQARRVTA